jgi:hypothetical protein
LSKARKRPSTPSMMFVDRDQEKSQAQTTNSGMSLPVDIETSITASRKDSCPVRGADHAVSSWP